MDLHPIPTSLHIHPQLPRHPIAKAMPLWEFRQQRVLVRQVKLRDHMHYLLHFHRQHHNIILSRFNRTQATGSRSMALPPHPLPHSPKRVSVFRANNHLCKLHRVYKHPRSNEIWSLSLYSLSKLFHNNPSPSSRPLKVDSCCPLSRCPRRIHHVLTSRLPNLMHRSPHLYLDLLL
jgi:hypothetical protein